MPTVALAPHPVEWSFPGWVADTRGVTEAGRWEAWIQTLDGTRLIKIAGPDVPRSDHVNLGDIKDNGAGSYSATFEAPKNSACRAHIAMVTTELVVSRSGVILFKGPILTENGGSGEKVVSYGARSSRWYLEHRLRGGYEQIQGNLLKNPRFDAGLSRWYAVGAAELDTVLFETGSQSVSLPDENSAIAQTVYVGSGLDYRLVCTARVWVDSAVADGEGLWVYVPGVSSGASFGQARVTAATPRSQWTTIMVDLDLTVRANARTITLYVFGAAGGIWLDNGVMTLSPKSLIDIGAYQEVYPRVDQATVIAELIPSVNQGLFIGVDAPLTGQMVDYDPKADIDSFAGEILARFEEREGGLRITEDWTPRSTTIRTHYPADGVLQEDYPLRFVAGDRELTNLTSYQFQRNGTAARSRLHLIGDDDIRVVAVDPEGYDGLLLDAVERAPKGTPIADLPGIANQRLRADNGSITAYTVEASASLAEVYGTLDMASFLVDDGGTQIDEVVQIRQRTISPKNDRLTMTLNPVPAP